MRAIAEKVRSWDYRIAKAFMDELPEAQRDPLARAYRALPSVADDARRYAQAVWRDAVPQPGRTLGQVTSDQAAAIAAARDLDVSLFDFSLSPDEVAHVRREHGGEDVERRRGQRAIAPADFAQLPELLNGTPRYVGQSAGRNLPVFEIAAEIGGEELVTRWEMWKRRRTFTLLNFFVRTGRRT